MSTSKNSIGSYKSLARYEQMLSLRQLAPRSRAAYADYLRKLAVHVRQDPATLKESVVIAYLVHLREKRGYSPSSMRTVCAAFRCFYQHVCQRDWRLFQVIRARSARTFPAVLTREEVRRLLRGIGEERFRVLLTLIYACGLRVGEAVALEVRDMQPLQHRIHVRGGKGARDRFVPATDELFALLRAWWRRHRHPRLLFPGLGRGWREHRANPCAPTNAGRADHPMSVGSVQVCMRLARVVAGLGPQIHLHTLRHSYATHLLEEGVNLRQLASYLGHQSLDTTSLYTHLTAASEGRTLTVIADLLEPMLGPRQHYENAGIG